MQDRTHIVFLDLSSAYDHVERDRLYEILKEKKVMPENKIKLLQFIHCNLVTTFGSSQVTTNTGVPQGLSSSPMLFNLYTENIIE